LISEHAQLAVTVMLIGKLAVVLQAVAAVAQTTGLLKLLTGVGAGAAGRAAAAGVGAEVATGGAAGLGAAGAGAGAGAGTAAAGGLRGLLTRIPKAAATTVIISELWGQIFNASLSGIDDLDEQAGKLREARDKIQEERFKMFRETGGTTKASAGQQAAVDSALGRLASQYPMFKEPQGYLGLRPRTKEEQAKTDKATIAMLQGRKFGSVQEVTGFLQGLKELQLPVGSKAALLRDDIQRLATAAWPQFSKELAALAGEAPQAASALAQVTEQLKGLGGLNLFTPVGESEHQKAQRRLRSWRPPTLVPSRAMGGLVERGGFAMVHPREAIVPARVTEGLSHQMMTTLLASRGGGVHLGGIHVTVQGNAESGIERKIARAIRAEFLELLRETGLHGLSDDGFRDRALAI
jgi:hypothetical protein